MGNGRFTRRAVIGGVGLASFDDVDAMRSTLRRLLGDFRMDDAAFAAFVTDFKAEFKRYEGPQAAFFRLGEFTGGMPALASLAPASAAGKIESFERSLLTNFFFTTDYLQLRNPAVEAIQYVGPMAACTNPFAQFD